jgi:hypothetical protein
MLLFSPSDFLNSDIVNGLDFIVNLITAIGLLAGIPWALINRKNNKLAAEISKYLHYYVRFAVLILLIIPCYFFTYFLQEIIFYYIFSGDNINNNFTPYPLWILSIFISISLGLSFVWILGSFTLTSTWDHAIHFLNYFLPPQSRVNKKLQQFEIIYATYGNNDAEKNVTDILQEQIFNNKVEMIVSNRIFTDPAVNQIKTLKVKYKYGNGEFYKEFPENTTLKLPHNE